LLQKKKTIEISFQYFCRYTSLMERQAKTDFTSNGQFIRR